MMGGLTSTVVGMMCKDAANVSTTAGGLRVVALVDLLWIVQQWEMRFGVAAQLEVLRRTQSTQAGRLENAVVRALMLQRLARRSEPH